MSSSATTASAGARARAARRAPGSSHLEQPGREARAEREAGQPLVDAEEDLLRQILCQGAVARQPQHVVEDRPLVGPHDDRERTLVTALGLPEDTEVRLWERHEGGEYRASLEGNCTARPLRGSVTSGFPVISGGTGRPSSVEHGRSEVGQLASVARAQLASSVTTSGTGFVVCAVCGLTPSGSSIISALPWSAVTSDAARARSTHSTTRPRHASTVSTAVTTAGIEPVCPTMSGFAKLTTHERGIRRAISRRPLRDLLRGHLRLQIVARDIARRRDENPRLALPLALLAAVEEVRDVRVLLRLGGVELAQRRAREHLRERVATVCSANATGQSGSRRGSASSSSGRRPPRAAAARAGERGPGRKLKKIAASVAGSSRGRPSITVGSMNSSVTPRS